MTPHLIIYALPISLLLVARINAGLSKVRQGYKNISCPTIYLLYIWFFRM